MVLNMPTFYQRTGLFSRKRGLDFHFPDFHQALVISRGPETCTHLRRVSKKSSVMARCVSRINRPRLMDLIEKGSFGRLSRRHRRKTLAEALISK